MPQTLGNGVRVPSGSDPSAPQPDMVALGASVRTILTAASKDEADRLVTAAVRDLGWKPSTADPIYVDRRDLGGLCAWDGTSWRPLAAMTTGRVAPLSGWTGKTSLLLVRVGRVVTMAGTIARSNYETITPVQYEIGLIPAGFRLDPSLITLGTTFYLPAISYVHPTAPVADAIVQIYPDGRTWVRPARNSSSVTVNGSWIAAA